ncbi:putative polyadenylate-binding protein-interacting protein 9 [Iris pallida]|uniref:Polyadenylate-binding protein-interacting protein 9 n=1 Tax=Iris pallida TaxID=29817 RepID=A0AAX6HLP7_IRIPA|nr:putative polyadenylate-binding protein-interacting protein 9 [Iris pallida]
MAAVAEVGGGIGSGDHRQLKHRSDVRELVDLSKLNPSAKEFVPSSHKSSSPAAAAGAGEEKKGRLSADAPVFVASSDFYGKLMVVDGGYNYGDFGESVNNQMIRKKKNGFNQGRRRFNERVEKAQKEDSIRRTVYVSDIDQHVTEEQLATLFNTCGQVLDCRVCGDPHSVLRFAFIEFSNEYGARQALSLGGTMLGFYPVKVLPSKTAILPVNPTFLPQSADEREMCTRTVYCTNIDRKVTQTEVKDFFESLCGEVSRLRLLGDHVHSTRIAFVEFVQAESALLALNCSGMLLRALPVRVSPSKTPVRPRARTASQ